MSQQTVYVPGFSLGVTLSTATALPGATEVLNTSSGPLLRGVPVPVVFDEGKTIVPSPYPPDQVLVPVLVKVTST